MTTKESRLARMKPICDICGATHWPREPHVLPGTKRAIATRRASAEPETATRPASPDATRVTPDACLGRSHVLPGKAWIEGWRCHCGHEWPSKGDRPRQCPKCKSRTWDRGGD